MKKPKDNVFYVTIEPVKAPEYSSASSTPAQTQTPTRALHGQDAMDSISDADSASDRSNKTLIPDANKDSNKKPAKISRWIRTQITKIRTSRTRQSLLAFFIVVVAVLLGVLLWLHHSGRLDEALKVRGKEGGKEQEKRHMEDPIFYYIYFANWSFLGACM